MRESRLISMCQGFNNGPERPFRRHLAGHGGFGGYSGGCADTLKRRRAHAVLIKVLHRVLGRASQNRDSYDADRA